ncbi:MAG: carboxymuconolactone decarboxylase family protein [Armatimonadota bacterium]
MMANIKIRLTEDIKKKMDAYSAFSRGVMRGPSGLTLVQRQMIATLTSALNGCRY